MKRPAAITIPPATTPSADQANSPSQAVSKKETSRIPLDAAKVTLGEAQGHPTIAPTTIKLKPASSPNTIKLTKPDVTLAADRPMSPSDKKKTSRISLEAALSSSSDSAQADGPKTIRLKRPSEASTIKLTKKPTLGKVGEGGQAMDKTAMLDAGSTAAESSSATGKKTIKVKKPGQAPGVVKSAGTIRRSTAGPDEASAGGGAEPVKMVAPKFDEPGVVFSFFAAITMIVVIVTIWEFAAQAVGPDLSLTQLSWKKTGPNLPWHSKIPLSNP